MKKKIGCANCGREREPGSTLCPDCILACGGMAMGAMRTKSIEALERKRYPMESRCAWCGENVGWKTSSTPGMISYGICDPCIKRRFPDLL